MTILNGMLLAVGFGLAALAEDPETVIARFQVKEGKEADFEKAHTQAWQVYRRLGLVHENPHLVMRGKDESGKTYFVEILTWKDRNVTEHAPDEVRALWAQLEVACEARLGHRAIEFPEVRIVGE